MKKSLRQLVLIGLSGMLIAGAAAPMVLAQDDTEDQTEQVEETTEEETTEETVEEETTEETEESSDMTEAEASEAQAGVDEAVAIFEGEYPDASIEEIDVELDTEESIYTIVVQGFDTEDNDYELEVEWVDGEVREQQFNEGLFDMGDGEDVDRPADTAADTQEVVEEAEMVETTEEEVPAESVPETDENAEDTAQEVPAESVPETDDSGEASETDRLALDLENLVTLDEATDTAVQEVGAGEAVSWNLTADTSEWWEFWDTDEENENPLWTIEVEDTESGESEEVRIDAVTGEILNLEDVDQLDEETTEETTEEAPEETVEETVEEQPEEAPEETDTEE